MSAVRPFDDERRVDDPDELESAPVPTRARVRARAGEPVGADEPDAPDELDELDEPDEPDEPDAPTDEIAVSAALLTLRVVDGLQAGAGVTLARGTRLRIGGPGGEAGDDIVLRDPDAGEARVELVRDASGALELRSLGGEVAAGGAALASGTARALAPDATFRVGGITCALAEAALPVPLDAGSRGAAGDAEAGEETGHEAPDTSRARDLSTRRTSAPAPAAPRRISALARVGRVGAVAAAAAALALGWFWHDGAFAPPPAETVTVESVLEGTPFAALPIERRDGAVLIGGHVGSRAQAVELGALLRRADEAVINRVESDEALADKVATVLRVNGIEAEVSEARDGEVRVTTAIADAAVLEGLEALVRADVPALSALAIDNTPPLDAAPDAAPVVPPDPGKRVAMVVSADPAHVLTEDQSRYFVGSLLPSGHRIAAIESGRVSLVKGGITTELEF